MTSKPSTLGQRIAQLREKKGISQKKIAEVLGLSRQQIGNYESDSSEPSIGDLKKIATMLSTTVAYLVGEAESEHLPVPIDEADSPYSRRLKEQHELFKKQTDLYREYAESKFQTDAQEIEKLRKKLLGRLGLEGNE